QQRQNQLPRKAHGPLLRPLACAKQAGTPRPSIAIGFSMMRATNISVSAATNSTRAIGGCPFRIQAVPFLPNLCEPTVQPIMQNAPSTTADAPHDPPRPVVRNVHWRSARIIVDGSGPTISDLERHREYPLTVLLAEDDA